MRTPLTFPLAGAALLAAAPALAAPPIQEHTCPNGLTVLVAEDHALPLVTVEIAAHNGSMTEPPDYNGLSHLYEHMFFKANKAIPTQEQYLARARELGMSWNGTTGTERVNYFFTTTRDHLDDAVVFMRDAIVSPLFEEKELAREREVVVGEIDRNHSTPGYHLWHDVTERVFWKYPSRKNPLGDAKTVRAATVAQMKTIQERYYIPNNSALVVTGDVKAEEIFAKADKLYADWKKGPDPFVKHPLATHPPIPKSEVVVVEQPVQSFTAEIVWQGPSTVGKDVDLTYAADLLGTALDEPSSRFQKALVDSGACVGAGFGWQTQRNVGPVTVTVQAAPDKIDACLKAAFAELPKIKDPSYLTDEEMGNAAHTLEMQMIHERERSSAYAHTITFWWASAGLDYYRGYLDHVKKVTRGDIARFLDGYVLGKPFVLGAMLSPEMAKAGATRARFEEIAGIPITKEKPKPAQAAAPAKKGSK
jgi:zinc protease